MIQPLDQRLTLFGRLVQEHGLSGVTRLLQNGGAHTGQYKTTVKPTVDSWYRVTVRNAQPGEEHSACEDVG